MKKNRVLLRLISSAILTSVCLAGLSSSAMDIIAHRGASFDAPENTLASMNLAWKQKADAVELDIHLSKDGRIIVIHDYDTKRVGVVTNKVVEQTFAELRKIDAGSWKGSQFTGEKLPTLDSVLATIPDGKSCFIEIKVGPEILPELEKIINASGRKPAQMPIITFGFETAVAAKKRFPRHMVSWLHDSKKDKDGRMPVIEDLIARAKEGGLDGLDLQSGFPVDREFVKKVTDAGLKLYVWTVDDPVVARKWADAGVHGITTNRPEWLREHLK